jgi:peptidase S41-like protein
MLRRKRIIRKIVFLMPFIACSLALRANAQVATDRALDPNAAAAAVDAFKAALDERWSYRQANRADFDGAISALRRRIQGGIRQNDLGIELQKIIALGIDGHSRVSGFSLPPGRRLPFLIEVSGRRFVAVDAERKAFLADGFPFLTRIDGHAIDEWCATASVLVVKGSPQLVRVRCASLLRELDYWRDVLKLPKKGTAEIELTAAEGKARKTMTVALDASLPTYGVWPPAGSRLLDGNIGCLRLTTMRTSASVPEIKTWMSKFRNTAGLIVDVRDNNGGDRDPLLLLYSYLAAPNAPPHVFNAAAYRLYKDHPENYLAEEHRMYRLNAREWSPAQRAAVARFAKKFKPQWQLPKGQFSDWHYIALTRMEDPEIYHYQKPVIVLLNGKSFSATDVFLSAMKGMKNVLLVGTPSSGGSAYSHEITLGETQVVLRIGTMASFQADGKLFDGNGIHPDVLVEPVPDYFIGGRDNVLEEAMRRIRMKNGLKRRG